MVPFSENDSVTIRTQVSKVIMRRSCPKSKVGTAGRSGVSAVRPVFLLYLDEGGGEGG